MPKSPKTGTRQPSKGDVEVDVSSLHEEHPRIRAQDWRSPLVRRLSGRPKYADGDARVAGSFRAEDEPEVFGPISLRWKGLRADFDQCVNTYQGPVLTEFATLGLACILLTRYTTLRISEVTRRGERVDYWIGDDAVRKRFVLEVGGKEGGSIDGLATTKTGQLQDNPWGRNGFVCVAVYTTAEARLWFCRHGKAS